MTITTAYAHTDPFFRVTALTANTTFTVPADCAIRTIWIVNSTTNAVTGGIRIGTTNGGSDVVTAQAVGASAMVKLADSDLSKSVFSTTEDTTLYIQAVTAWNSASVGIYVDMVQLGFA